MKLSLWLIDGHNLLHADERLREVLENLGELAARTQCTRELLSFADASESSVAVVYDGRGRKTELNAEESAPGLQVFYSGGGDSADSVIERFARAYCEKFRITVVSADHAILDAVHNAECESLSPAQFGEEQDRVADQLKRRIGALR